MPSVSTPRSWNPERLGLPAGELVDRLLEREVAPVAHVAGEQQGRVARRAQHLHVGTGVRRADEHVVVEQPASHLVLVGVRDPHGDDARRAVVGQHEVGEHVRRVTAACGDEVGERLADPLLVVGVASPPRSGRARCGCSGTSTGRPCPTRSGRSRATGGSREQRRLGFHPAGLHDPVPALGHAHEHHAAVPVDAEVDAAGRELGPDLHALLAVPAGEVEPVLHPRGA